MSDWRDWDRDVARWATDKWSVSYSDWWLLLSYAAVWPDRFWKLVRNLVTED